MDEAGVAEPELLLATLAHLPLAVGVIDANGAIRYVNPAAEALYGWKAVDVVGRSALSLGVAPSDTAAAADLLAKVQLGETWRGRFPLQRADGRRVPAWMSVASLPVEEGAEEEPGLLVVALDVDDLDEDVADGQRAAEGRAEEANLLVQGLLDAVPVGMAFFDRSLRYVRVNSAIAETNGLPVEAHVGQRLTDLLQGLPQEVADDITSVFATGDTIPQRLVIGETPAAPGVERHWLVSYYPIRRGAEVLWVGSAVLEVTERDRLLVSEQEARRMAEATSERLARLQAVTGRLAEANDLAGVADIVVRHGGVGADGGALCVVDGDLLRVMRVDGMEPSSVAKFETVGLDAALPITDAVRSGEPVFLSSIAERDERYPGLVSVPAANRSFAAVPMLLHGRAVGCIALGWAEERTFDDADAPFLLTLGRQAALALERARLYQAEREARAAAEEATDRMRFLAEASRVLSSSLDYEATLAALATLAVPTLGDVCLVHLLEGDDLRLVFAAHRDPDLGRRLEGVAGRPTRDREPRLLGRAIVTGQSLVLHEVPDELLRQVAEDDEQLDALRALRLRSGIVVPLHGRDGVLGVFTLAADAGSDRRFGDDDLPFAEDLGARVAVAIENSRSHQARTEVARTLQQSLLPPHLPAIPGIELAQRYESMGDLEVGGDFFDVFPAGPGRWGVVIGDVCGKGVAAASLTALARYTVRAGAIEGHPSGVLRLLNRAILDSDPGERFCTIAHAMLEPGDGTARLVLACGGHPLPLVLRADGTVDTVGVPGTAVGLFDEIEVTEVEVVLRAGDALAFHTDGFTEARSPEGDFDPDLLARVLATAAGRSAEDIAEIVQRQVLAFEGGRPRDDMALLVLRVPTSS
ncbi:MAG: SpoIIE family protein phosphatase [Actinomycetota bacterium]|nr:SpoIIE family protein phosphatase [Actinomycetota bacterium]